MGELTTAVKYGMPITHVLLEQRRAGEDQQGATRRACGTCGRPALRNPSFAAYAELCGAQGIRVERPRASSSPPSAALAHDGPSLVEVIQDPELV